MYFNGQILRKANGIGGNFYDFDTQDEYWVSGVKKNGGDRHGAGNGKISIDEEALAEYLKMRNLKELPLAYYNVVSLIKIVDKERHTALSNEKF